uniref:Undecaprenyl-PP-MurNAc-pentapeptide-UDPGlcNAc GlcNAc transferase n=1 Tax=candidate division WOR-3 bacterium TaxID=2052148 RepID=A0A7V1EHN6_UNCW3
MGKFLIIISGIGTGGHYFPALVVAEEFMKNNIETIFLVRRGFPEEEMAKKYGLKTFYIAPKPYYGKSILNKIIALWKVFESVLALNKITKKCAGISFGGFGSLPLILSCMVNRQFFFLFEPNCIPGRTTRMFARFAKKVFLGLPGATHLKGNVMLTGIPVRQEFKRFIRKENSFKKTILFMGGSQGARRLNEIAIKFQRVLPQDFRMIIISGRRDFEWVNKERDFRTEVISFTTEPWNLIARADVVISRAGALSGYELLTMKKSVIFVPFPYAVDDHQYYNAQFFAKMPNVKMILEKDLNEKILYELVMDLLRAERTNVLEEKEMMFDAEKVIVNAVIKELG